MQHLKPKRAEICGFGGVSASKRGSPQTKRLLVAFTITQLFALAVANSSLLTEEESDNLTSFLLSECLSPWDLRDLLPLPDITMKLCSSKNFPEMQFIPPFLCNSSLKLPQTPLSPFLLPSTDPSQLSSRTCILHPHSSSTITTKAHFLPQMSYFAFTHRVAKFNFPYATEKP